MRLIDIPLQMTSFAFGVFHGYCDGQGFPLNQNFESVLNYLPAVGSATIPTFFVYRGMKKAEVKSPLIDSSIVGGFMGGVSALETVTGYFAGYLAGRLTK